VDCDTYDIPGYATSDFHQYDTHEGVPFIDSAAAYDEQTGELNVFVINRNWKEDTTLDLDVSGFGVLKFVEHKELFSEDLEAANSFENPDNILPGVSSMAKYENGKVKTTVKKLSWNVLRFKSVR
jgi:alpha-N-arabinofuranosidase